MLRGNHELRDVNGWVEHYGERSFLWQCQVGEGEGEEPDDIVGYVGRTGTFFYVGLSRVSDREYRSVCCIAGAKLME